MSDEKRPSEQKELQDTELDNVSGGVRMDPEVRNRGISPEHGGGISPEHGGGINPDERLGGGW